MGIPRRPADDDRGVSDIVGYVLLIGLVVAVSVAIVATGMGSLGTFQASVSEERTQTSMQLLDARLSSLSGGEGRQTASLDIGPLVSGNTRVVRSGSVTFVANGNDSCRATVPLTSVRTGGGDTTLIYEMGGLWRRSGNGSVMVSPPTFSYDNETLSVSVANLTGRFGGSGVTARLDAAATRTTSEAVYDSVFAGTCSRPDNFTVTITSDVSGAWADYVESEFDAAAVTHKPSNDTVRVHFGPSDLPVAFDRQRNDVIDLRNTSQVTITNSSIVVAKNNSNSYHVVATPLVSSPTVSRIQVLEGTHVYRPPIDVVFTLDESGSMDGGKMASAKDAAKTFVGELNRTYDRAGVVGYDYVATYYVADGHYLSKNYPAVNDSIEALTAGGGTNIYDGIYTATSALDLVSNSSRNRVIILLSDGEATEGPDPVEAAKIAADSNVTIHTIGFGDPDEATMREIANITGGTYRYVSEDGDLTAVFRDLFARISDSKHVVRTPITMGMAVGSDIVYPSVGGNDTHIARVTLNGTRVLNVNDPTAPGGYAYSFTVNDSVNVTMNSYSFECASWARTGRTYTNNSTDTTYAGARCTEVVNGSETVIPPSNATILHDGDDISPLLGDSAWWEEPLDEQLAPYLNGTTLDLASNEAIIVYDYPNSDGASNRFVVRYRIGRPTSAADYRSFLRLSVPQIEIGSD